MKMLNENHLKIANHSHLPVA